MKEITGNILDITEGIICHQVNCKRVAGAGLAKQIADKYPAWLTAYKNTSPKMGSCFLYYNFNYVAGMFIASLYGQFINKRITTL